MASTPGDNSEGILLSVILIGIAGFIGYKSSSAVTGWSIFLGTILFVVIAYFGLIPGVDGAWCKDKDGYTTKYRRGKCQRKEQYLLRIKTQ